MPAGRNTLPPTMPARQTLLSISKRPLLQRAHCTLEYIRITSLNSPCRASREESLWTSELQSVESPDRFRSDNAELATLRFASSSSTSIRDANVPGGLVPSCKLNGSGNHHLRAVSSKDIREPRIFCSESEQLRSRACERLSGNRWKFMSQDANGWWPAIVRGEGYLRFRQSQQFSSCSFSTQARAGSPKEVKSALATTSVSDSFATIEVALDSVVKVFTVSSSPNYFLPWQNKPQREITGSGFVISGRRILTNAHVVADQTFVKVRKHGSPEKFKAKVEAVGHECDLALLIVEENEFWEGMLPLEFGGIPYLQEAVAVVGYPQGGDNISVTGGVVSRVEPTQYVHGASHLMAVQIDAAINPGNSGGPALMDDKVVGVAFQNLANAENIGYIIPVPVISHFLEDVEERGKYVGFCTLGLTCQSTENGHLRENLNMPDGLTGVLVSKVHPLTDTHRWVKKDDVILAFDGHPIANDGTVHFRNRERITFDHLVSIKKAGETGLLRVLRNGKELEFMVKLGPIRPLVPIHQFDQLPSYFIFAGLVFTPLIQPYLHEYGEDWYNTSPRKLCELALHAMPTKFGEQIVVLSQVLVDDVNAGYERLAELQVKKVNGVDILNLRHLRQLVDDCKEISIRFDLEDGRVVVLNYQASKEASLRILDRHRIPAAVSKDLMETAVEENVQEWEKSDSTCEEGVAESVCLQGSL